MKPFTGKTTPSNAFSILSIYLGCQSDMKRFIMEKRGTYIVSPVKHKAMADDFSPSAGLIFLLSCRFRCWCVVVRLSSRALETAIQMNIPTVDKMNLSSDALLIRREEESDRGCDFARVSQPVSKRYLRGDGSQFFSWIRKFL